MLTNSRLVLRSLGSLGSARRYCANTPTPPKAPGFITKKYEAYLKLTSDELGALGIIVGTSLGTLGGICIPANSGGEAAANGFVGCVGGGVLGALFLPMVLAMGPLLIPMILAPCASAGTWTVRDHYLRKPYRNK